MVTTLDIFEDVEQFIFPASPGAQCALEGLVGSRVVPEAAIFRVLLWFLLDPGTGNGVQFMEDRKWQLV